MKAIELFQRIEHDIPLSLAVAGDKNGYMGTEDPEHLEVQNILVILDYIAPETGIIDYSLYDLLILHHPPLVQPVIPSYVIHSNWDIIQGGACDALADTLHITSTEILDESSGIGRIGQLSEKNITQGRLLNEIMATLRIQDIRVVNYNRFQIVDRIGIISGFGLSPKYIQEAIRKNVDVFISGDMIHQGAVIARNSGITLIDATHYATEFPGLCRLGERIASFGPDVQVKYINQPWIRV